MQDDKGKSNIAWLSSDNLLACLMTCGSQKVNETMYLVLRHLLNSKTCRVCDTPNAGSSLPGLTYLKSRVKSSVRSLVAKHDILQLDVNLERAGAKHGVDKYKSLKSAPVVVVKPSEWARIDFSTPSIRKVIWEDVVQNNNVFKSIEYTPIVRNRNIFPVDNIAEDEDGIEHVVVKNDLLKLTLIRNGKIENMLGQFFAKDVTFVEVDSVACASVKFTVLDCE